jgi:hypothetical protein
MGLFWCKPRNAKRARTTAAAVVPIIIANATGISSRVLDHRNELLAIVQILQQTVPILLNEVIGLVGEYLLPARPVLRRCHFAAATKTETFHESYFTETFDGQRREDDGHVIHPETVVRTEERICALTRPFRLFIGATRKKPAPDGFGLYETSTDIELRISQSKVKLMSFTIWRDHRGVETHGSLEGSEDVVTLNRGWTAEIGKAYERLCITVQYDASAQQLRVRWFKRRTNEAITARIPITEDDVQRPLELVVKSAGICSPVVSHSIAAEEAVDLVQEVPGRFRVRYVYKQIERELVLDAPYPYAIANATFAFLYWGCQRDAFRFRSPDGEKHITDCATVFVDDHKDLSTFKAGADSEADVATLTDGVFHWAPPTVPTSGGNLPWAPCAPVTE